MWPATLLLGHPFSPAISFFVFFFPFSMVVLVYECTVHDAVGWSPVVKPVERVLSMCVVSLQLRGFTATQDQKLFHIRMECHIRATIVRT